MFESNNSGRFEYGDHDQSVTVLGRSSTKHRIRASERHGLSSITTEKVDTYNFAFGIARHTVLFSKMCNIHKHMWVPVQHRTAGGGGPEMPRSRLEASAPKRKQKLVLRSGSTGEDSRRDSESEATPGSLWTAVALERGPETEPMITIIVYISICPTRM